jgi:hypothetical protein
MKDSKPELSRSTVETVIAYCDAREKELQITLSSIQKDREFWLAKLKEIDQNEVLDNSLSN